MEGEAGKLIASNCATNKLVIGLVYSTWVPVKMSPIGGPLHYLTDTNLATQACAQPDTQMDIDWGKLTQTANMCTNSVPT